MTTATGTAEDSDPVEDKRVQADVADMAGSALRTPVYDAGALAAFLRGVAPMMEQEIKRGAKSTALRCDTAQQQAAQAVNFVTIGGRGWNAEWAPSGDTVAALHVPLWPSR